MRRLTGLLAFALACGAAEGPARAAEPFVEPLTFAPEQAVRCAIAADPTMGYRFSGLEGKKVRMNTIVHGAVEPDSKSTVLEDRPSGADDMIFLLDEHMLPGLDVQSRSEVILFRRSAVDEALTGLIKLSEVFYATTPEGVRYVSGWETDLNQELVDCVIE